MIEIKTCKDCSDRFYGCHSVCPRYITEKNKTDIKRMKMFNEKELEHDFNCYHIKAVGKSKKERGGMQYGKYKNV